MKKKIVLTIPRNLVGEPVVYNLVKKFDIIVNVLRAQVTSDEGGRMVAELEGSPSQIEQGLRYIKKLGVSLELVKTDIRFNRAACIDCGACTAVCGTGALSINKKTWELEFDRAKCVLCGLCVNACPMKAIQVTF